jgi:hypothetical protein
MLKAQVLTKRQEVDRRLLDLGLTQEILRDAVRAGELERVSCTPLDPKSFPGTAAWALCVRKLREFLLPRGWKFLNKKNLPLVVDPVRLNAIVVTSGSAATGLADREPTTKYPQGPATAGQVKVNRQQGVLFGEARFMPLPLKNEFVTWLLLIRVEHKPQDDGSVVEHRAVCELSLPAEINEKGMVTAWAERIILDTVKLDEPAQRKDDDEEEELDVPVTRRK